MHHSKLSHAFTRTIIQAIVALIVVVSLFFSSILINHTVKQIYNMRLHVLGLSHELLISTRYMADLALSYVATGDMINKEHYDEIVDIKDGKKPRSNSHYTIFSFLKKQADKRTISANAKVVPLIDRIQELDLTKEELNILNNIKKYSEELENIEKTAIHLIDSGTDRERVLNLLHNQTFRKFESLTHNAILELSSVVNLRVEQKINKSEALLEYLQVFTTICSIVLLFLLWDLYRRRKRILGGNINDLYTHIMDIGSGNFCKPIEVPEKYTKSILGWLKQTQMNLKNLTESNERLKNFYTALSHCNQAIIHTKNQQVLFDIICENIVNFAGMETAWIGMLEKNSSTINITSVYGFQSELVKTLMISCDPNNPDSKGTIAQAILTQEPTWCTDYATEYAHLKWHALAKQYNLSSLATLPLKLEDKVVGVLVIFSKEKSIFDDKVKSLLEEMASDISFALENFRKEAEQVKTEKKIIESHNLLTSIINTAPIRIFWTDTESTFLGCNTLFAQDRGVCDMNELIGKKVKQLIPKELANKYEYDDKIVMETGIAKLFYEEKMTAQNGQNIYIRTSKIPLRNNNNDIIGVLGMYEDISVQKKSEERNRFLANNDLLTGLSNRTNFSV